MPVPSPDLYRKEALESYRAPRAFTGRLVHLTPVWMRASYWLLVAVALAGLGFGIFGSVADYSSGPAWIRAEGRTELRTTSAATVSSVDVTAGQQVRAGQVLVRMYSAAEQASLARIEREFDAQLVQWLKEPSDEVSRSSLRSLRATLEEARRRLADREMIAPQDGVIGDVWVRPGQALSPGELVTSLAAGEGGWVVVALLPGRDRPRLRSGAALRLELEGYPYAYQALTVSSLGEDVSGPEDIARAVGLPVSSVSSIVGPRVVVRARLAHPSFIVDGRPLALHEGMAAQAEVPTTRQNTLVKLFPWLRNLGLGRSS